MIVDSITELIGNTPLVRIPEAVHGLPHVELYAKLELLNPFGSIKDRVALSMLKPVLSDVRDKKITVIENSSGNTAKALQAICGIHGLSFHLVSALARVREQKEILRILGATIEEVPNASDCFDPNDPHDPQFVLERRMSEAPDRYYFTSQFTNPLNPTAHLETTGDEIVRDLGHVDYLFAGVGTAGSSMGVIRKLREVNAEARLVGLTARRHDTIPGIRSKDELWENGIFQSSEYSELVDVSSREAIEGLLVLNRRCGILAGPSSGANYQGALKVLSTLASAEKPIKAVFFACDRVDPYLSYIKVRRADLFGMGASSESLSDLTDEEVNEAHSMTPREVLSWLETARPLIIDTRSTVAFMAGSLPYAMNYPLDALKAQLSSGVPFNRHTPLLLVCQRGVYTRPLAAYLGRAGFDARNLSEGLGGWRNAGLPLVRPDYAPDPRPASLSETANTKGFEEKYI
jgi:cysteine synthase B